MKKLALIALVAVIMGSFGIQAMEPLPSPEEQARKNAFWLAYSGRSHAAAMHLRLADKIKREREEGVQQERKQEADVSATSSNSLLEQFKIPHAPELLASHPSDQEIVAVQQQRLAFLKAQLDQGQQQALESSIATFGQPTGFATATHTHGGIPFASHLVPKKS